MLMMNNSSLFSETNLTAHAQDKWDVPFTAKVFTLIYLSTNLVVAVTSNSLLILIIHGSPTLRTPANSHLVNICTNNLILCCAMLLSAVSMLLPVSLNSDINILTGLHILLISNCLVQYWSTFAAIGYYRSQIIQRPSLPIRRRRQIITRCLSISWVVAVLVSFVVCLSHIKDGNFACLTLNPFQKSFILCDDSSKPWIPQRMGVNVLYLVVFLIIFIVIVLSYHRVLKMLKTGKTLGRNKILPVPRSASIASVMSDSTSFRRNTPCGTCSPDLCTSGPYVVSAEHERETQTPDVMVHYSKHDGKSTLSFNEVIALENPILAASLRKRAFKRPLRAQQSTGSTTSTKSNRNQDFSDISAEAAVQRYQLLTNRSALRNYFLRRDRAGFNSATKNSLVMMVSLFLCSSPLFVSSIPQLLTSAKGSHQLLILMFTTLIFYLNAPIFPLWYLIQNRRVRRCMTSMFDNVFLKLRH